MQMDEKIEATVVFNPKNYSYKTVRNWFTERNFEIKPLLCLTVNY